MALQLSMNDNLDVLHFYTFTIDFVSLLQFNIYMRSHCTCLSAPPPSSEYIHGTDYTCLLTHPATKWKHHPILIVDMISSESLQEPGKHEPVICACEHKCTLHACTCVCATLHIGVCFLCMHACKRVLCAWKCALLWCVYTYAAMHVFACKPCKIDLQLNCHGNKTKVYSSC